MTVPKCSFFNVCNGCSSQHINYDIQLKNKLNSLSTFINFDVNNIKVFSSNDYFYRSRMDLFFTIDGLALRDIYNKLVHIDKCVISNKLINDFITEINDFFINPDVSVFNSVIIRAPHDDSGILFILNQGSKKLDDSINLIKIFSEKSRANNIIICFNEFDDPKDFIIVKCSYLIKEKYLNDSFVYPINGFSQNNHDVAELMHKYVNNIISKHNTKDYELLDLYAGIGTFGINNSKYFNKVTIIESVHSAIECANLNVKNNNIDNSRIILLDAKNIKRIDFSDKLFVITDPPRSGMDENTIIQLKKLKPEVIIYISCNIKQLSVDIRKFKNYKINNVALFDLFPQTNHSEAIVELVLNEQ